jgi:hypothetical protein
MAGATEGETGKAGKAGEAERWLNPGALWSARKSLQLRDEYTTTVSNLCAALNKIHLETGGGIRQGSRGIKGSTRRMRSWTIRLSIAPKNYGNFRPAGCASLKQDDVTVHSQATPNPATRVARRVAIEPIREGACAGDHRVQRSY